MVIFFNAVGFGLVTAAVIAIGAVGLTLQVGITNFVNFAYGEFLTMGAYVGYWGTVVMHLNLFIAILLAMIVTGTLALVLNEFIFTPFVRTKARLFIMLIVTIGVSLILQNTYQIIFGTDFHRYNVGGNVSHHIGPFLLTTTQLMIMALATLTLGLLQALLKYTKLGKSMRAMSDSADLAEASGLNTRMITRMAWLLSGALAGVGGVALALSVYTVTPGLGNLFVLVLFAAVVLGGTGRPFGAMLASLVIGVAMEVSGAYINAAYKTAVAFAILILVLLVRPNGIFATKGRAGS
jgi:branched-subunit amino acid ABC-type transport system permease component